MGRPVRRHPWPGSATAPANSTAATQPTTSPRCAPPLPAITETTVKKWLLDLEVSKAAGKTVQNKHAFLSGALKAAVRGGLIDRNPCEGQRIKRTERREMVMLSRDEFDQVHAAIGRELWADLAMWLVSTGMRFGRRPRCAPPTSTSMPAPAGSPARGNGPNKGGGRSAEDAAVGAHHQPARACGRRGAAPCGRRRRVHVRQRCRVTGTSAELLQRGMEQSPQGPRAEDSAHPRSAPHLRLLDDRRRVPLVVVSRHLGHEDITTTANTYSHVDRASGKAAADAISKILG